MTRRDDESRSPPVTADMAGPVNRSLRRAGLAAGRCWWAAGALPVFGGLLLLLLPFVVLLALTAELLALLFGGVVRATVSWTAIFACLGLVLGLIIGGEAVAVLAMTMGIAGLLLGLVLGWLCGPLFHELPEQLDRNLSA